MRRPLALLRGGRFVNDCLRREERRGDRSGVPEGEPYDFGRGENSPFEQRAKRIGCGVEAYVVGRGTDLFYLDLTSRSLIM